MVSPYRPHNVQLGDLLKAEQQLSKDLVRWQKDYPQNVLPVFQWSQQLPFSELYYVAPGTYNNTLYYNIIYLFTTEQLVTVTLSGKLLYVHFNTCTVTGGKLH